MSKSYRDIPFCLKDCTSFRGNSMHAIAYAESDTNRTLYDVYSYATCIACVGRSRETGRLVRWINPSYYSPTTSRHVNLCRAYLPGSDVDFDTYKRTVAQPWEQKSTEPRPHIYAERLYK